MEINQSAIGQLKATLEKDGFIILPESVHDDVLAELKKQGIDTTHVFRNPPDNFNTIVSPGGCFESEERDGGARLVKKCCPECCLQKRINASAD